MKGLVWEALYKRSGVKRAVHSKEAGKAFCCGGAGMRDLE